jgi:hypothetical protein
VIRRLARPIAVLVATGTFAACAAPPPAAAFDPAKPICSLAGLVSTLAGKVCSAASHPGRLLSAGKKLLGGHVGGALESLSGAGTAVKAVAAGAGLAAIVVWVAGGARFALRETATVIAATTRPQLESTWFSGSYWRMAAISALLTLPFLFAAAIQALLRSDMAMLARSAFAYLPLGMLAVSIAAPMVMLLLSASDELSAIVSSASGNASGNFLARAGAVAAGVSTVSTSPFLAFVVGLLTVAATITLWVELLIRSAAVSVIVLMLPLFFAALVWPARRVWAVRAVELLVALILSKFAIVAVLSLGGAALGHTPIPSAAETLEGTTLVVLAAFSPWALLRLLPLHELASGLDGLRTRSQPLAIASARAEQPTELAQELARELPAELLRRAGLPTDETEPARAAVLGFARNPGEISDADARGDGTGGSVTPPDHGPPPRSPDLSSVTDPGPTAEGDAGHEERLPGMEARWQAPDNSWRPLVLGLEGPAALPRAEITPALGDDPPGEALADDRAPGDEHDPRPPAVEPDGGPL